MRFRNSLVLAISLSLLLACQAATTLLSPSIAGDLVTTPAPAARDTPTPFAAPSLTPLASPVASPQARQGGSLPAQTGEDFQIRLHPDPPLYSGDQVSAEIIAPDETNIHNLQAVLSLGGTTLGQAAFGEYGIGGRKQATLYWVWDTTGLEAGNYPLVYTIQPTGLTFTETVTLLPAGQRPASEANARWASTSSECCLLHYITGSAAQRDLAFLVDMIDQQAHDVSQKLGAEFQEPVSITLLPRVMGHGGFTSNDISVSYLDRNYAGSSPQIVLHHELVHVLDGSLGGDLRPTLLLEGLAVYLTGGHFKPEVLMPRAAALLDLNWYLPLDRLADSFYPSQHEIGYLEAGALVEFMVKTWGWQAFSDFYRDIHPIREDASHSKAIDAALRAHFGLSLSQLEEQFLEALRAEKIDDDMRLDVRQTVRLYDAIRKYQQILDPSAYFMTAWLPDSEQMRQRGIVADYLRHPTSIENQVIEALLVAADARLQAGDYSEVEKHLEAIDLTLRLIQAGVPGAIDVHPLTAEYQALITLLSKRGFEAQRISIEGDKARVWGTSTLSGAGSPNLTEFNLVRGQGGWKILQQLSY